MSFGTKYLILAIIPLLAACSGSGGGWVNPADIKPVYGVFNSPTPVPRPRMKPPAPSKWAKAKPATAKSQTYLARASGQKVTVRKGETLYALSRRHSVAVVDLARVNGLRPPYALAIGQKIILPSKVSHSVRKGETSYAIAQKYGVRLSDLIRVNGIKPPYGLAVGQKLAIPGGAKAGAAKTRPQRKTASRKPLGPLVPPPKTGKYFAWPVKGTIISRYGPKQGGVHNDGINLVARRGQAIVSAEAGVVAYASDDLPGYGNLILIKHSGNWVTAYAHTENMRVQPGQVVKKGQTLAFVGNSGGVEKPQLHFEIRRGSRALNPLLYLERLDRSGR